jgi:hypothetical protein
VLPVFTLEPAILGSQDAEGKQKRGKEATYCFKTCYKNQLFYLLSSFSSNV